MDAHKLAHEIADDVKKTTSAPQQQGAGFNPQVAIGDFCAIWPQAKPVLQMAGGIIQWIPGAGTMAGTVLLGLIKIGDQVAAEVCKGQSTPTHTP
jgi:hypothetical protein